MKTVFSLICAFAGLLLTGTGSYAQVTDGFSFGLKAGANRMNTKIINRPSNYNGQLRGVGVSNGFQVGAWATLPVSRWLFVDTDLYFQQRENKYEDPSNRDIVFAYNTYRYAGVSGRLGFMYKRAFVSIGPEVNVLLATKTMGQNEAQGVEWGINARLGYQYRRVRIEAFYTKALTHYEQKTFIVQGDKLQHLFYGNTLGLSLGVRLFGGKERR
jgi:hypothetical protein